ncbi:hypothetical protein EDB85DRAFT_1891983 [Lactarius pseudohatsudake]|nr:hypothetical protein EDB85DRAFT_1891983 [Lactarius pseudohatsudake]
MYWADTQLVISRAFVTIVVVGLVWPVLVSPVFVAIIVVAVVLVVAAVAVTGGDLHAALAVVGYYARSVGVVARSCVSQRHGIGADRDFVRRGDGGGGGPTYDEGWRWWTRADECEAAAAVTWLSSVKNDAFPLPLAHCTLRLTFTTHLLASDAGATSDVMSSRLALSPTLWHNTFITIARGPQAATIMTTGGGRLTWERQLGGNDPDRDDQDYDEATPTTAARQRRPRPRPQQLEWWRRLCGYDTHDHHGHDGYSGGRSSATTTAATTMVAVEAAMAPMTRPQQRDLQQQQQQPGLATDHEHHKETPT